MKKQSLILVSALALAVTFNTGCGNQTDSKEVAEDANEQKMESNQDENDAEFVVNAYNVNLFEAMLWCVAAWHEIVDQTIRNCLLVEEIFYSTYRLEFGY